MLLASVVQSITRMGNADIWLVLQNVLMINLNTWSSVPPMNTGRSLLQRWSGQVLETLRRSILFRGKQKQGSQLQSSQEL